MGKIFPRKYQFIDKLAVFSVLVVFLTSGVLMASLKIMSQKKCKNLRHYRYSSRRRCPFHPIKNAPFDERRKYRGVLMEKKIMKHNLLKPSNWTGAGGTMSCL